MPYRQTRLCEDVDQLDARLRHIEDIIERSGFSALGQRGKLSGATWEVSEERIATWTPDSPLPLDDTGTYVQLRHGQLEIRGGAFDIHTGETGAHMKLTGEYMRTWNADGDVTFDLDFTTGDLLMRGELYAPGRYRLHGNDICIESKLGEQEFGEYPELMFVDDVDDMTDYEYVGGVYGWTFQGIDWCNTMNMSAVGNETHPEAEVYFLAKPNTGDKVEFWMSTDARVAGILWGGAWAWYVDPDAQEMFVGSGWFVNVGTSDGAPTASPYDGALIVDSTNDVLYFRSGGSWHATGAGGGEANTGANVGTHGVGVYDGKSGVQLQFRHVAPASNRISVVFDSGDNDIDIDVVQANLDHGSIGGLGDDDHTQYLLANGTRSVTANWNVDGADTLYIDKTNGRVGIKTTVPDDLLEIKCGHTQGLKLSKADSVTQEHTYFTLGHSMFQDQEFTDGSPRRMLFLAGGSDFQILNQAGSLYIARFRTDYTSLYLSGVEKLRFNSVGLGVMTNNPSQALDVVGTIEFGANSYGTLYDDTYTVFMRAETGKNIVLGANAAASNNSVVVWGSGSAFTPNSNEVMSCGDDAHEWSEVWALDTTINHSDLRDKDLIEDTPLGLEFIRALRPRRWKWKERGHRYHHGLVAQEVKEVLDQMGISTEDFAGYVYAPPRPDPLDPDKVVGDTYHLRYAEFIAPLIVAVQELADRMEALEGGKHVTK